MKAILQRKGQNLIWCLGRSRSTMNPAFSSRIIVIDGPITIRNEAGPEIQLRIPIERVDEKMYIDLENGKEAELPMSRTVEVYGMKPFDPKEKTKDLEFRLLLLVEKP